MVEGGPPVRSQIPVADSFPPFRLDGAAQVVSGLPIGSLQRALNGGDSPAAAFGSHDRRVQPLVGGPLLLS